MKPSPDWSTPSFELPPASPDTGPFPHLSFLQTWWDHRAKDTDRPLLFSDAAGVVPLVERDGVVEFMGEPDLTDYHSPLGRSTKALVAEAARHLRGLPFQFDSLPEESAEQMAAALSFADVPSASAVHESTAVLRLPGSFEDWLGSIGKKERHEVRRKRRRCEVELGNLDVVRGGDAKAIADFVQMHRSAAGDKGSFMTDELAGFFRALVDSTAASVDTLLAGDRPVAAVFGWESDNVYYLYNSSYDSRSGTASPGAVLLTMIIERQIARGTAAIDLLKGDEPYKYRLGAEPRPLFRITGRFP